MFLVEWASRYCCLLVGISGRMVVALLSSGGCFWLTGCHFMVVPGCQDGLSGCQDGCLWVDVCGWMGVPLWLSLAGFLSLVG